MKTLLQTLTIAIFLLFWLPSKGQNSKLKKLHNRISTTQYDEFAPCVSPDGFTLYFTRVASPEFERTLIEGDQDLSVKLSKGEYAQQLRRVYSQLAGKTIANPEQSVFNQDIWMAQSAEKEFDIILHPGAPLNNALPNSISAVMPSTNEVILVNQFIEKGGMKKGFSKSKRNADGSWTFPISIPINNFHNSGTDVNVTISDDGKTMILALERPDAFGRSDLYICFMQKSGNWSAPKNLGRGVNTAFREATPHLSVDGKKLYFSSDRGNKKGNNDIYVQKRLGKSWDRWSAPQKFRAPINSNASDSHPYFCKSTGQLYFSSNRDGNWDIFKIQIAPPKPDGLIVQGQIFNDFDLSPIDALITSGDGRGNSVVSSTRNGKFRLLLPWNSKIKISARKKDFKEDYTVIVTGPKINTKFIKETKLYLEPIDEDIAQKTTPSSVVSNNPIDVEPTVGSKLKLDHIYFQQSTAFVLDRSYPEIDRLGNYLLRHPDLTILISGHTDNQGDKAILKKLSEERADAIKSYLVSKRKINKSRIKTIGYGADQSLNDNSTDRLRKINRRVEVEIIGAGESASRSE